MLGRHIGIAIYPEHATTAELLLQRTDAATYRARLEGSGIEVYAAETDPYAPRRLALAADLREALERDEVDVYVQPKVSLTDGMVIGAEALVRWTHPRLGPLQPDQFIPAAEHTGVIRQLTIYVVRGALAQCRDWRDAGLDLTISVNLSSRNLFDIAPRRGHRRCHRRGGRTGVGPHARAHGVDGHGRVASIDGRARGAPQLGLRLSVDDFGTGYSSLTHLRSLPVTELKIDKSFVMTMTVNDQDAVIVRTLVDLGRSLGLHTVAEGVESPDARRCSRSSAATRGRAICSADPFPPSSSSRGWLASRSGGSIAATRSCSSTAPSAGRRRAKSRPRSTQTSGQG